MRLLAPPLTAVLCLLTLLSAGCSIVSFTWVNGGTYRYLGGGLICAEDGSLVVWQQANAEGKFGPVRATARNCVRPAP